MYKRTHISAAFRYGLFTVLPLLLSGLSVAAQEAAAAPVQASGERQFYRWVFFVCMGILVLVLLQFVGTVNRMLKAVIEMQAAQAGRSPEAAARLEKIIRRPSVWKKILRKMTAAEPLEKEHDILLDHDYDGIRELDNHLPPWWKWGFYFSIVFAVLYFFNYQVAPIWNEGYSQTAEYDAENVQAELALAEYRKKAVDLVDETNVVQLTEAAALDKGRATFSELCAACHGDLGQGGIGPNLTDRFWLHGGDMRSVFKTIKYGVSDKGMIAWKDEIKPGQMQAVASYVLSLQGSNPPGGKEPQGEPYVPAADSSATGGNALPPEAKNPTAGL